MKKKRTFEEVKALKEEGFSMRECSEKLGVSSTNLYSIIHSELTEKMEYKKFLTELRENKKEKIKRRVIEECQKGKTLLEIAETLEVKQSSIHSFLRYYFKEEYKEIIGRINENKERRKLQEIKKYLEKGYSVAEIAKELKYSIPYMYLLIRKIN